MAERIKPTRSGLFAIELLIAVGVFSLCAAICVGLFVRSEVMSQESADTGGQIVEDTVFVAFDENWEKLGPGAQGTYEAVLACSPESGYTGASLSVQRYERSGGEATGTTILLWNIAALEVAS